MLKQTILSISAAIVGLTFVLGNSPVYAEEAYEEANVLEEVIVRARKRVETAQLVPISVSVLTAQDLSNTGFSNLSELTGLMPNVSFSGEGQSTGTFSIRGVSTTSNNAGFETGNGLYVDEVYVGKSFAFNRGTVDLESIELLRGPQGTLFGRNTIGGLINVRTKDPVPETEASIDVSIGNYDYVQVRGVVGGTLSEDRVFGRLAIMTKSRDGFLEDFNTGAQYNNEDSWELRGKLLFTPTDNLSILWSGDYYEDENNDSIMDPARGLFVDLGLDEIPPPGRMVGLDYPTFQDRQILGTSLRINYDADGYDLTSITAYREHDNNILQDQDFTVLPIFITGVDTAQSQFSQELRLSKMVNDRFNYILGFYYFNQSVDSLTTVILDEFLTGEGTETGLTTGDIDGNAYAFFGSISYVLSENLTLDMGLRWTYEDKQLFYEQVLTEGAVALPGLELEIPIPAFKESISGSDWSGNISLTYAFKEDVMAYGVISRGYKAGGFNATILNTIPTTGLSFDPEYMTNYEIGLKSEFFNNRLRFNIAGFFMDYTDKQEQTRVDFEFKVANAGAAEIKGWEVELIAIPFTNFRLAGGYGYNNAKYTDFPDCVGLDTINCSGRPLVNAPKNTAYLAADYDIPMNSISSDLFMHLDVDYRDKSYSDFLQTERFAQEARTLVNARIGVASQNGRWSVALWGRNIFDEETIESSWDLFDTDMVYLIAPRTYGIEVKFSL